MSFGFPLSSTELKIIARIFPSHLSSISKLHSCSSVRLTLLRLISSLSISNLTRLYVRVHFPLTLHRRCESTFDCSRLSVKSALLHFLPCSALFVTAYSRHATSRVQSIHVYILFTICIFILIRFLRFTSINKLLQFF